MNHAGLLDEVIKTTFGSKLSSNNSN